MNTKEEHKLMEILAQLNENIEALKKGLERHEHIKDGTPMFNGSIIDDEDDIYNNQRYIIFELIDKLKPKKEED